MKIRLLIIEDNRVMRRKLTELFKPYKDIEVTSVSAEGKIILSPVLGLLPHVIVLDVELYNRNCLELIEEIKCEAPGIRMIVMAIPPQCEVMPYIKAGASGFILQDASSKDFVMTIRKVSQNRSFLPPSLVCALFAQIVTTKDSVEKGNGKGMAKSKTITTKREQEIISLLSAGMSNKEISKSIGISTFTVKSHIHNIMEKLMLHSRLELANYAYSPGECNGNEESHFESTVNISL